MIIFLFGKNCYLARKKLNEIVKYYKKIHKSGLNLKFLEGENLNFQDFKNLFDSQPMFKEKKLIVLKNIFSNQKFKEEFLKEKEKFLDRDKIILIYEKNEIQKKDIFFQFLKNNAKYQEFKPLEGKKLENWVKKEFERYQVKISPQVLEKLINFVGNDLWQMENEIKKILTFKKNGKIKEKDIESLISNETETNVFKVIEAILKKDRKEALKRINFLLTKGTKASFIISIFKSQFRKFLIIKDLVKRGVKKEKIISKTKFHPFLIERNLASLKKMEIEQLEKIYQKIFQLDKKIKTGKILPEVGLNLFIVEII